MAVAAMVLLAGGFLTHRANTAISDGYRWTAEAQAAPGWSSAAVSVRPRSGGVSRIRNTPEVARTAGIRSGDVTPSANATLSGWYAATSTVRFCEA